MISSHHACHSGVRCCRTSENCARRGRGGCNKRRSCWWGTGVHAAGRVRRWENSRGSGGRWRGRRDCLCMGRTAVRCAHLDPRSAAAAALLPGRALLPAICSGHSCPGRASSRFTFWCSGCGASSCGSRYDDAPQVVAELQKGEGGGGHTRPNPPHTARTTTTFAGNC